MVHEYGEGKLERDRLASVSYCETMREPIDRERDQKTAFTVLKVLIGCGLFGIVLCAGLVFFLYGLCASGKLRVEQPEPSEVRVVRSWP